MSPIAHLLASWVVAAKTTTNARDCRLVTLAGMVPDADGLGLVVDLVNGVLNRPVKFAYLEYHHFLLHGVVGALAISALAASLARDRWRVALLAFAVYHLHLLGDLLGSRGPTLQDIWPVFYLGPFSRHFAWTWRGQWALDAWPNRLISVALLVWSLRIAVEQGHSVVGVFHRRADAAVVAVLRKWRSQWLTRRQQRT